MRPLFVMATLCVLALLSAPAFANCADAPEPCQIAAGSYHIELPANRDGPLPAVMFIHGYGSSGDGTMTNRGMVDSLLARGYAVVAPDGVNMQGRNGRSWNFRMRGAPERDEVAFLKAVRDDAAERFDLDADRMLLAGFSVGGSMVSYLACTDPGAFAAYAPVSGGFWRPHPEQCAGPVRLLHTHGWTDTTVPLEGRILRGDSLDDPNAFAQGDIFRTLEIWRAANGCNQFRADKFDTSGFFWRRSWDRCTEGSALEFAMFPGNHSIPKPWADMAIDWFEGLQATH